MFKAKRTENTPPVGQAGPFRIGRRHPSPAPGSSGGLQGAQDAPSGKPVAAPHDPALQRSVVGGLLGIMAGAVPPALSVLFFGVPFAPLFILLPVIIGAGLRAFRGYRDGRGVILLCLFTLAGIYPALLSAAAASYIMAYGMSVLHHPLVMLTLIGQNVVLPGGVFSMAVLLPCLLAIVGIIPARELLTGRRRTEDDGGASDRAG